MRKIITISREFGSGGRIIGKKVAENLGYEFFDREIIDMAAKDSGLSADFIEKTEQNISSGWLYNLLLGTSYSGTSFGSGVQQIGAHSLPLADQVFNAERKIILGLADKPCVIVGRCADYIFRTSEEVEKKELLNIFIYADFDDKVKRVAERLGIDEKEAAKTVTQVDKRRANHYNTFTEDTWGDRQNYDLIVNSSTLGIEQTVEMLTSFIKKA
nr:cytidylate kinase-like family protein [Treponema sp.]